MEKNMSGAESREKVEYAIVAVLSILMYLILMWILTGNGLFSHNTYNSYALQAESWCKGRLDLGQNYSFLELAFYKGKYYVSFPPFPSYLLLPFALFGEATRRISFSSGWQMWLPFFIFISWHYPLSCLRSCLR